MERKQFTFYESFARALKRIKKDSDRAKAYDSICDYALYGVLPDLENLPDAAALAFDLIKPTLDASAKKAKSGKDGGKAQANAKQTASKPQANAKQTAREKENEKEKEYEVEKENECYIFSSSEERKESPSSFLPDERRKYGKYVLLTFSEFGALLNEYGPTEFQRRKDAVDLPENEGKDFAELIREVG